LIPAVRCCSGAKQKGPPGEWQQYDIIWTAPTFNDGTFKTPAKVIAFFNGILI